MNDILLIALIVVYVWSMALSVYSISVRGIEPNIFIVGLYFCPVINTLYVVWRLVVSAKKTTTIKATIKELFEE